MCHTSKLPSRKDSCPRSWLTCYFLQAYTFFIIPTPPHTAIHTPLLQVEGLQHRSTIYQLSASITSGCSTRVSKQAATPAQFKLSRSDKHHKVALESHYNLSPRSNGHFLPGSRPLHHLLMLYTALKGSPPSSLARLSSFSQVSSLIHWWLEKSSLHFPL